MECQWFLGCHEQADKDVHHPTLGWVLTCDAHIAWLGNNPSPTQFVPPIVAKHGKVVWDAQKGWHD